MSSSTIMATSSSSSSSFSFSTSSCPPPSTSSSSSPSPSPSSSSQVQVGVRIRPLTNKEKSQGGKSILSSCSINRTATILNRKFTYDAVYDSSISQTQMYDSISGGGGSGNYNIDNSHVGNHRATRRKNHGMLEAFLDGYNSTIMAYGQTGSGKTYTMGSEATSNNNRNSTSPTNNSTSSCSNNTTSTNSVVDGQDEDFNQGLIPRFMKDIFTSLEQKKKQSQHFSIINNHSGDNSSTLTSDGKKANNISPSLSSSLSSSSSNSQSQSQLIDYSLTASFLEIYSEEIHDLLSNDSKQTLPIRDDANGGVVVVGLKEKPVKDANEALQVLNIGTLNRTTAQTLMNKKSSRSHAVFTIYLKQTIREFGMGGPTNNVEGGDHGVGDHSKSDTNMDVTTISRFTFVDLAGSERLKKTGAEGERAREGIKINEGLLALGNVINALGDEERLMRGEKVHVPYRQSKLTRLLQDALGGNSKTLFLACVSPSDTNASETVSTLKYANRARNIKNAPTKNIDASVAELQRLYSLTNMLERELVRTRFGSQRMSGAANSNSGSGSGSSSADDEENKDKDETNAAMEEIGEASEQLWNRDDVKQYLALVHEKAREQKVQSSSSLRDMTNRLRKSLAPLPPSTQSQVDSPTCSHQASIDTASSRSKRQSSVAEDTIADTILDVNPDEDIAILDKILELQHLDQEFDKEIREDEEKLNQVQGELEEQETLLLQLKENLKAYLNMKERFEAMMIEVQALESEKTSIAKELERVQLDPSKGCSKAIKKRLEKVEANLSRARTDARKHQQMYRKAEQQAQKVSTLQSKIDSLKHGKVSLMKKQREAAAKHKEVTDKKSREIMTLKKKERKDGHKLSKLESEVQKHKKHLEKRAEFCEKLSEKLKQTESHLMKVLSQRKRDFQERTKKSRKIKPQGDEKKDDGTLTGFAPESEELSSLKFLIEKIVSDRASVVLLNKRYEAKVAEYSDFMRNMVAEMKMLKQIRSAMRSSSEEEKSLLNDKLQECNQNIEDLELKLEVVGNELESIRSRLPSNNDDDDDGENSLLSKFENDAMKMIANLSAPVTKTLLWDILDTTTKVEIEKSILDEKLARKEAALESFEQEIETLNQQVSALSHDLSKKHASPSSISTKDNADSVSTTNREIKQLEKLLTQLENENTKTQIVLQQKIEELDITKEKLALLETSVRNDNDKVVGKVQPTMEKAQSIWKELGLTSKDREVNRKKIDSCLEDTCTKILDDAQQLKKSKEDEINALMERLLSIYSALGQAEHFQSIQKNVHNSGLTYFQKVGILQAEEKKVLPTFYSAVERVGSIAKEAKSIIKALDLPQSQIGTNLAAIIDLETNRMHPKRSASNFTFSAVESSKDERAKKIKKVEEMMKALECGENDNIGMSPAIQINSYPKDLSDDENDILFERDTLSEWRIGNCENDLKKLKMVKSEIMVTNQQRRDAAKKLTNEMNLNGRELLSLGIHSIKKRIKVFPEWWDPHLAEEVCRSIVSRDCVIGVCVSYTKHLDIIGDSLESVSSGRSALSDCLKGIIEGAHNTLLKTVEEDADVNEAYASFDKALSRLPKLSKEHICACIDEMNTLVIAVDAMSQSEMEALTVVWESLNVTNSDKGQFWSDVKESTKTFQSYKSTKFENVKRACAEDMEEWVISAVKESMKINRTLGASLLKLSKIHDEVEKLRSKSDAKSKILSLDSQLRIQSLKLAEFEEKAGNKHRLVTKKLNSSSLLQEERFRKQMQGNFSSRLHKLVDLLKEWQAMEGCNFNEKLLSEDVNAFLKDPEHCGDWIEKRTAFMHLKTVNHRTRRRDEGTASCSDSTDSMDICKRSTSNGQTDSDKRSLRRHRTQTSQDQKDKQHSKHTNRRHTSVGKTSVTRSPSRQTVKHQSSISVRQNKRPEPVKVAILQPSSASDTPQGKRKKAMTVDTGLASPILPFGDILAKTPIQNKENIFM